MVRCRRGRRKGAGRVLKSHKLVAGNILPLHSIPEGTVVCNIKRHDGDCGVVARASADYAIVISHNADYGTSRIKLPSGARKIVPSCYCAEIRQVWSKRGSTEKSLYKAKNTFHYSLKRNTSPKVPGVTFNPEKFLHGGGNNQNNRHVSTVLQDEPPLQKLSVRRTECLSRQAAANRQVGTHGRTALMWNPENYSLGKHQHIGHRTTARQDAPPTQKLLRRIRCLSREAAANRQDGTPGRTAMMCNLENYSLGKHQHIGHRTTARQDAPPPQKLPIIRTGCLNRLAVANRQDGTPGRTAMMWNPENYSLGNNQHIGHRTTARRDAPPGRQLGLIVRRRTERIRGQALVGRIGVFMASRATSSLCRQAVVACATDKSSLIF